MKINKRGYEVFVMFSPVNIPLNFANHNWFVINERGKLNRYEVFLFKNSKKSLGHLFINYFPPFDGINIITFIKKWRWKAKFLYKVNGQKARKLIKIIKNDSVKCPAVMNYHFLGNNSNTYIRWALNKAKINKKLTWNSFGN